MGRIGKSEHVLFLLYSSDCLISMDACYRSKDHGLQTAMIEHLGVRPVQSHAKRFQTFSGS